MLLRHDRDELRTPIILVRDMVMDQVSKDNGVLFH